MTLSEHLDELRSRLIRCVVAAIAGFVLCFWRVDDVVWFLRRPLEGVTAKYPGRVNLVQTSAGEYVIAAMTVSFFAGLVLVGPYILWQIWGFVAAGLYTHERRSVRYYALPGFGLFFAGAAMAYFFVLPWCLDFLIGFAPPDIRSLIAVGPYISFVAWMMFVFGLIFQLPMIMVFLMRLGVVEPATFRRHRRIAIVVAFVVGAVLTPPDVVSQCFLAGTLLALYEGAIIVGARVARRRQAEA